MSSNSTTSQGSFTAPGAGITGGYTGDSLTLKIFIAVFAALSIYNALELILLVFVTFSRYSGIYFYSLLIASWGILPYSVAFLLKFFEITDGWDRWISITLLTVGWYAMVTGQSVVLWSRLHLIVVGERGRKILIWTKWMIIVDAIIFHIPTTVLTYGSNGGMSVETFVHGYNIYEKVQMMGFFIQEVILSSIYIHETIRILRTSLQCNTRRLMYQLFAINIFIIIMDLALVGVEFANFYIIETILKGAIYSIKLKLEYAVLGKLVAFVTNGAGRNGHTVRQPSTAFGPSSSGYPEDKKGVDDVPDFVDRSRSLSDVTHAPPSTGRKNSRPFVNDSDLSLARFEHVESPSRERSTESTQDFEMKRYEPV